MNPKSQILPPNPYVRQPIKRLNRLAGRKEELDRIRYYLRLTSAGQSPHLALIGSRGVGKTSLLNAVDAVSRENQLLPIRLDLDQGKASSAGRFWRDLYSSLLLASGSAGCWGGLQGDTYASMAALMYTGEFQGTSTIVLQAPLLFGSKVGHLDDLDCPVSIISHDLGVMLEELGRNGLKGGVIIIDEADCLGQSVPLLQALRNTFQRLDSFSIVLAGTDSVFPALTDVFSPIPRQFHRIDVRPFASWAETRELVAGPLQQADSTVKLIPSFDTVRELHELCGGDPAELQLYCHHMYRQVERGLCNRMQLHPEVFREVMTEYRANVPDELSSVIEAVQQLPEALLYKSPWIGLRELSVEERIRFAVITGEIHRAESMDVEERQRIAERIRSDIQKLSQRGIVRSVDDTRILGAPFTTGFWKSFVEVEKKQRWSWRDSGFRTSLIDVIVSGILKDTDCLLAEEFDEHTDPAVLLKQVRAGKSSAIVLENAFNNLLFLTRTARSREAITICDLRIRLEVENESSWFVFRYGSGSDEDNIPEISLSQWLRDRERIFLEYGMVAEITTKSTWTLPENEELQRLAWILEEPLDPDDFGPHILSEGTERYRAGDYGGAASKFLTFIDYRDDASVRNNAAYCYILLGQLDNARRHLKKAMEIRESLEPLPAVNLGVLEALEGNSERAIELLTTALVEIEAAGNEYNPEAVTCMLILQPNTTSVVSQDDMPVDAAIVINLAVLGAMNSAQARAKLAEQRPGGDMRWPSWIEIETEVSEDLLSAE